MITVTCDNCGKSIAASVSGDELDIDLEEIKWLRLEITGPLIGVGIACSEDCAKGLVGGKIALRPRPVRRTRRRHSVRESVAYPEFPAADNPGVDLGSTEIVSND